MSKATQADLEGQWLQVDKQGQGSMIALPTCAAEQGQGVSGTAASSALSRALCLSYIREEANMPTLSQVVKEALADGQQGPVVALEDGRGRHHQPGAGIQAGELVQPLCYPVSILLQAVGGSCDISQRHLACNRR